MALEGRGAKRIEALFPFGVEGTSDWLRAAARDYDPSMINRYLVELASAFHKFYNADRIKGEERAVLLARLKLADCVRVALENALAVIGVRGLLRRRAGEAGPAAERAGTVRGGAICGALLFLAVNFQQFGIAAYPPEAAGTTTM